MTVLGLLIIFFGIWDYLHFQRYGWLDARRSGVHVTYLSGGDAELRIAAELLCGLALFALSLRETLRKLAQLSNTNSTGRQQ